MWGVRSQTHLLKCILLGANFIPERSLASARTLPGPSGARVVSPLGNHCIPRMKCPNDQETRFSEVLELEEPFGPCLLFRDEQRLLVGNTSGSTGTNKLPPEVYSCGDLGG